MSKILDFKKKLLGLYHNRNQAFSQPQQWAYIYIKFEENEDMTISSKSWYAVEGEEKSYRQSTLELKEINDSIIVLTDGFEIEFNFIDNYWIGESKLINESKNSYILTSVKFDGKNYFSKDGGYSLKNDRFIWGKDKHEGHFHFIKQS